MKKRKMNITVQYALRYFIVIIATTLLIFLMVGWILQEHKNTLVDNVRESVHTFMQQLDMSLIKQQTLAQEIFSDELTAPGSIESHPLQTVKGIKQLELYQNALLLNDYLFLKYPGYDELILHIGTISPEGFMKYELKLEEESKEVMRGMLENYSASESAILIGQTGENIFIWSYPFRNSFTGKKGIVSFGITGSTLEAYLHSKVQNMPFYAALIDDDGQVLFEIKELSDISETDLKNVREKMLSGEEILVKGYTTDVYDSVNGFTFCIVLDDNYILSDFRQIVTIVLFWGSIIFVFAILLISFVNNVHIKQIRNVRDGLLKLQKGDGNFSPNEFSQIQDLIKTIYQEQSRKAEERYDLNRTMSELIAKLLLSGKLEQREDMLKELVSMFCPGLQNKYYTVLGVVSGERCDELVKKLVTDHSIIVCLEEQDTLNNLLYLVMGLPDADTEGKKRKALAGKLLDETYKQGIQNLFVVTGRTYGHLHEVSASYHEALLLTNILLDDSDAVVGKSFVFENMLQEKARTAISEKDKLSFAAALKDGTVEEANDAVYDLFEKVFKGEGQASRDFGVYVLADWLEELFRGAGCEETQLSRLQEADFEDAEALQKYALRLIACKKADNTTPIEEILEYINTNYKDNTMGLDTLAAQFNMSVSSLSRRIKDSIGENYFPYQGGGGLQASAGNSDQCTQYSCGGGV